VQEVYDKKVLHRLVGISPKATVVQEAPQLNGVVRSNGSIVQSAWEPTERPQETDDEGRARKSALSTKARPREVIDVDANDDESRYDITHKRRRKMNEIIDAKTVFTTDEESEGDAVIEVSEDGGSLAEEEAKYGYVEEMGIEEEKKGGQVKINRKRAFWAAKSGTGTSSVGT
jgi:non-canonical poly(A) RNA polymerase PAPD5/7